MGPRIILLVILSLSVFQAHASCSRPLRKQIQDWQPYSYADDQGRVTGLDNDILVAIAKEAGCSIQFVPSVPGKRALLMFQKGEIDVLTGFSLTPERQSFARFTHPYRDEVIAIFTISKAIKPEEIKRYEDILNRHLHLIAPLAGFYGQGFADAEASLSKGGALSRVEGDTSMLQMLAAGHGDLIIGDEMVIPYIAKSMHIGNLQRVALEANRDKVYIGLSKTSTTAEDLMAINTATTKLLANGTIAAIIKHYVDRDR